MSAMQTALQAPAVIAAFITASLAAVGVFVGLYAGYLLKRKEFRVAQLKARIDVLEQAISIEDKPDVGQPDPSSLQEGIKVRWRSAQERIDSVDRLYARYKWLLNPEIHKSIEGLLNECRKRGSSLIVSAISDPQQFHQGFPVFIGKTEELTNTYEQARLATLKLLYLALSNEVNLGPVSGYWPAPDAVNGTRVNGPTG